MKICNYLYFLIYHTIKNGTKSNGYSHGLYCSTNQSISCLMYKNYSKLQKSACNDHNIYNHKKKLAIEMRFCMHLSSALTEKPMSVKESIRLETSWSVFFIIIRIESTYIKHKVCQESIYSTTGRQNVVHGWSDIHVYKCIWRCKGYYGRWNIVKKNRKFKAR